MLAIVRTPKRYGHEWRARKRSEPIAGYTSKCITRPMTSAERAWMDSLPKPKKSEKAIGANLWMAKD